MSNGCQRPSDADNAIKSYNGATTANLQLCTAYANLAHICLRYKDQDLCYASIERLAGVEGIIEDLDCIWQRFALARIERYSKLWIVLKLQNVIKEWSKIGRNQRNLLLLNANLEKKVSWLYDM